MMMKKLISLLLLLVLIAAALSGCASGEYPSRTITMIIPYGAGGTTDLTGREFASMLEEELGVTISVVNQGGASGSIGCATVLDAAPDGYTLLFMADSLGTQRVMGLSDISYDDFTPIMAVADDPKIIVVAKDSPYQTLGELVDALRSGQDKHQVKMSYTGPGGSGHVQSLIYNGAGLSMSLIAYSSGSECLLALMSGQVDFTNANLSTAVGYIESGELRLLGVCASQRLEAYPEVPSLTEILPETADYMSLPFTPLSLLVAKDTPDDVVETLRSAAAKAVLHDDWLDYCESNSLTKLYELYKTPEETVEFYHRWESSVSWLLYDCGAAQYSPEQFGIARP